METSGEKGKSGLTQLWTLQAPKVQPADEMCRLAQYWHFRGRVANCSLLLRPTPQDRIHAWYIKPSQKLRGYWMLLFSWTGGAPNCLLNIYVYIRQQTLIPSLIREASSAAMVEKETRSQLYKVLRIRGRGAQPQTSIPLEGFTLSPLRCREQSRRESRNTVRARIGYTEKCYKRPSHCNLKHRAAVDACTVLHGS